MLCEEEKVRKEIVVSRILSLFRKGRDHLLISQRFGEFSLSQSLLLIYKVIRQLDCGIKTPAQNQIRRLSARQHKYKRHDFSSTIPKNPLATIPQLLASLVSRKAHLLSARSRSRLLAHDLAIPTPSHLRQAFASAGATHFSSPTWLAHPPAHHQPQDQLHPDLSQESSTTQSTLTHKRISSANKLECSKPPPADLLSHNIQIQAHRAAHDMQAMDRLAPRAAASGKISQMKSSRRKTIDLATTSWVKHSVLESLQKSG